MLFTKCDLLSELSLSGIPNLGNTSLSKNLATVSASGFIIGQTSTHLLNLSSTTKLYLYIPTFYVMSVKSIIKYLNGLSGAGVVPSGAVKDLLGFYCALTSQFANTLSTMGARYGDHHTFCILFISLPPCNMGKPMCILN